MSAPLSNPLLELHKLGVSVWLDDIGRGMLDDGSLARLVREDGVAGLTSNPAIFAHSIMNDTTYTQRIARLLPTASSASGLYEDLALADLQDAAALLRPLYDSTRGGDGFVSMEVSPHLADDSAGSLKEAQRLWQRLSIPNAFIKIPGTEAGLPVIRDLIAAGINVNVTLLFSPDRYRAVARAYRDGLSRRAAEGKPLATVASVASFFLSRIDSAVDKLLDGLAARGQPAARALRGKAAIASAVVLTRFSRRPLPSPRGRGSPTAVRVRSGCFGPPLRPRTRPTVPSSTSRSWWCPGPSTPCRSRPSTPTGDSAVPSSRSSVISPRRATCARASSDSTSISRVLPSSSSVRA